MRTWQTESAPWRHGPWSIERRGGELADIGYDDRRVLRAVGLTGRDRDGNHLTWQTEVLDDTDRLRLSVRCDGAPLAGTLTAAPEGDALAITLDLAPDPEAEAPCTTEGTGLTALHPARLAGTALRVRRPDGTTADTGFPAGIVTDRITDIAALAWEHDGLAVDLSCTGAAFAMEDRRQWTGAAFATGPRSEPHDLAPGDRLRQTLTLTATARGPAAATGAEPRIVLVPGGLFPEIALGAATAPSSEADPAPGLPLLGGTVLVELDLRTPNWPAALERAASAGLPLDVRVTVPWSGSDLTILTDFLAPHAIARIAAFDPDTRTANPAVFAALRAALDQAGLRPPLVAGTRGDLADLLRHPDAVPDDAEAVAFSVAPLTCDAGTEHLLESVPVQRLAARQAVAAAGGRLVLIGPVTLRPRAAAGAPLMSTRADLADGYGAEFTGAADPRQADDPLTAWTIAAAAALAVPGVGGLAWYEEWGPRGVRSAAGDAYPVAAVLETLDEMSAGELLWAETPDELIWALGSRTGSRVRIAVANLDRRPRAFAIAFGEEELKLFLGPLGWAVID
ncbi:hypothetical protein SAMN05216298_1833 [Glycomyces sambucus]|uniref:Uncharacterized protein n=1 Tax=Glycomyces sambucus TaxID=380244 RepID=A0A1G9FJB6_9ACTN|nr:hypothetical protein [Glycomyces sambucus]SDK88476.1 hypothetical protein SAMN05216298_1833 [Glycomyces sambucus]